MPTLLFMTCCAIEVTFGLVGYAFGSWLAGLVAGAVLCTGLIWEMGQ